MIFSVNVDILYNLNIKRLTKPKRQFYYVEIVAWELASQSKQ